MELHCPKHPHYKGIRAPKADCSICEKLYALKVQIEADKKVPKGHRFDSPDDLRINRCESCGPTLNEVRHHDGTNWCKVCFDTEGWNWKNDK